MSDCANAPVVYRCNKGHKKLQDDITRPLEFNITLPRWLSEKVPKETEREAEYNEIHSRFSVRNILKQSSEKPEEGDTKNPKDITSTSGYFFRLPSSHRKEYQCLGIYAPLDEDPIKIARRNKLLEAETKRLSNSNIKPIIRILTDPLLTHYRGLKVESDIDENEHETHSHKIAFKSERKEIHICKSRSKHKRDKKKMDSLVRQLKTFSIGESNKNSECSSLKNDKPVRNVKKTGFRKHALKDRVKQKKKVTELTQTQVKNQDRRDDKSIKICIEEEVTVSTEEKTANQSICKNNSATCSTHSRKNLCSMLENTPHRKKDIFFMKNKMQKCKERIRSEARTKMENIIQKIINMSNERNLALIVERLTAVDLTENVSTEVKKSVKPTQTHLTPV